MCPNSFFAANYGISHRLSCLLGFVETRLDFKFLKVFGCACYLHLCAYNYLSQPTLRREGKVKSKGASSKKGKHVGVTTNVYSMKTLEKPKREVCEFWK